MLTLKEISFNHNSGAQGGSRSSLMLGSKGRKVDVPEWKNRYTGYSESKTCYAINLHNDKITLWAKIDANSPVTNADVYANIICLEAPGILGTVKRRNITFNNNTFEGPFELESINLKKYGVGIFNVEFEWKYDNNVPFAASRHTVYVILDIPTSPWPSEENKLIWTEVLDQSCKWAKGAKNHETVGDKITDYVFNKLGHFQCDNQSGGMPAYFKWSKTGNFISNGDFDCRAFLEKLNGGTGNGNNINCSDCAAIVVTFSNILGCGFKYFPIYNKPKTDMFAINKVLLIGNSTPYKEGKFSNHEIAVMPLPQNKFYVFDACLELWDGGTNQFNLAASILLGDCSVSGSYIAKLIPNTKDGCGKIQLGISQYRGIVNKGLWNKAYLSGPGSWSIQGWKGPNARYVEKELLKDLDIANVEFYYENEIDPMKNIFVRIINFSQEEKNLPKEELKEYVNDAFDTLSKSGMFKMQKLNKDLGETAFTGNIELEQYVLMKRGSIILEVRSIGPEHLSVFDFAKQLDNIFLERNN